MTVDPKNVGTYLSAIRNFHLALGLPWVDIRDHYRVEVGAKSAFDGS